ncbi:LOW QUALITY PROTEIN: hypothetical protein U9M48_027301 [Paspalum notatum var. saurae]|uniref:Reverse transcriptase domain-containing protein n=1 Tax=Paspalum notatum var. saurae TaxID=547442 RepID=A0AAQ3TYK7_PASNO
MAQGHGAAAATVQGRGVADVATQGRGEAMARRTRQQRPRHGDRDQQFRAGSVVCSQRLDGNGQGSVQQLQPSNGSSVQRPNCPHSHWSCPKGEMEVSRLNYGVISLIPKIQGAVRIQQYRLICLLNCLYKLITKVLTLRLEPLVQKLIHRVQTAFLKVGTMILHEILHETKKRKEIGVILKLDFEKAYDKVNWKFLLWCLEARGFCNKWCDWIKQVMCDGTVSVRINGETGKYVKSYKGVRQGDPLSSLLFNFAYADDTIVCLKNEVEYNRNLKLLLGLYEMMSGHKINFDKSEVIMINVPVSPSKHHISDWLPLEEKILKRLESWKSGSMPIAGRIVLINSCLTNAPIYHMSMYLLHKTVIARIDKCRRNFLWQGGSLKKKYHLVKWSRACEEKKRGGLGIKSLSKLNISLLCKWWWKLETEDGLWQDIVKVKYLNKHTVRNVGARLGDSPVWRDMLKVKSFYLQGREVVVKSGDKTLLWHDPWVGDIPLSSQFPTLFSICENKEIRINGYTLNYRQWDRVCEWLDVADSQNGEDIICWKWGQRTQFTVKSFYKALTVGVQGPELKHIWRSKIPPKIKIFLWFIENNVLLTKDNTIKRKWDGDPICYFCNQKETIDHLFFTRPIAKVVWGLSKSELQAMVKARILSVVANGCFLANPPMRRRSPEVDLPSKWRRG